MPTREQIGEAIAIILLLIGFGGILITTIVPQNLNILLLAMLAVAIFFANQRMVLDQRVLPGISNLRYLFYFALAIGFPYYFIVTGSMIALYSAALALGLSLANWIFRQNV